MIKKERNKSLGVDVEKLNDSIDQLNQKIDLFKNQLNHLISVQQKKDDGQNQNNDTSQSTSWLSKEVYSQLHSILDQVQLKLNAPVIALHVQGKQVFENKLNNLLQELNEVNETLKKADLDIIERKVWLDRQNAYKDQINWLSEQMAMMDKDGEQILEAERQKVLPKIEEWVHALEELFVKPLDKTRGVRVKRVLSPDEMVNPEDKTQKDFIEIKQSLDQLNQSIVKQVNQMDTLDVFKLLNEPKRQPLFTIKLDELDGTYGVNIKKYAGVLDRVSRILDKNQWDDNEHPLSKTDLSEKSTWYTSEEFNEKWDKALIALNTYQFDLPVLVKQVESGKSVNMVQMLTDQAQYHLMLLQYDFLIKNKELLNYSKSTIQVKKALDMVEKKLLDQGVLTDELIEVKKQNSSFIVSSLADVAQMNQKAYEALEQVYAKVEENPENKKYLTAEFLAADESMREQMFAQIDFKVFLWPPILKEVMQIDKSKRMLKILEPDQLKELVKAKLNNSSDVQDLKIGLDNINRFLGGDLKLFEPVGVPVADENTFVKLENIPQKLASLRQKSVSLMEAQALGKTNLDQNQSALNKTSGVDNPNYAERLNTDSKVILILNRLMQRGVKVSVEKPKQEIQELDADTANKSKDKSEAMGYYDQINNHFYIDPKGNALVHESTHMTDTLLNPLNNKLSFTEHLIDQCNQLALGFENLGDLRQQASIVKFKKVISYIMTDQIRVKIADEIPNIKKVQDLKQSVSQLASSWVDLLTENTLLDTPESQKEQVLAEAAILREQLMPLFDMKSANLLDYFNQLRDLMMFDKIQSTTNPLLKDFGVKKSAPTWLKKLDEKQTNTQASASELQQSGLQQLDLVQLKITAAQKAGIEQLVKKPDWVKQFYQEKGLSSQRMLSNVAWGLANSERLNLSEKVYYSGIDNWKWSTLPSAFLNEIKVNAFLNKSYNGSSLKKYMGLLIPNLSAYKQNTLKQFESLDALEQVFDQLSEKTRELQSDYEADMFFAAPSFRTKIASLNKKVISITSQLASLDESLSIKRLNLLIKSLNQLKKDRLIKDKYKQYLPALEGLTQTVEQELKALTVLVKEGKEQEKKSTENHKKLVEHISATYRTLGGCPMGDGLINKAQDYLINLQKNNITTDSQRDEVFNVFNKLMSKGKEHYYARIDEQEKIILNHQNYLQQAIGQQLKNVANEYKARLVNDLNNTTFTGPLAILNQLDKDQRQSLGQMLNQMDQKQCVEENIKQWMFSYSQEILKIKEHSEETFKVKVQQNTNQLLLKFSVDLGTLIDQQIQNNVSALKGFNTEQKQALSTALSGMIAKQTVGYDFKGNASSWTAQLEKYTNDFLNLNVAHLQLDNSNPNNAVAFDVTKNRMVNASVWAISEVQDQALKNIQALNHMYLGFNLSTKMYQEALVADPNKYPQFLDRLALNPQVNILNELIDLNKGNLMINTVVVATFVDYKRKELTEKIKESEAKREQLQEQINELNEKLEIIEKKANESPLGASSLDQASYLKQLEQKVDENIKNQMHQTKLTEGLQVIDGLASTLADIKNQSDIKERLEALSEQQVQADNVFVRSVIAHEHVSHLGNTIKTLSETARTLNDHAKILPALSTDAAEKEVSDNLFVQNISLMDSKTKYRVNCGLIHAAGIQMHEALRFGNFSKQMIDKNIDLLDDQMKAVAGRADADQYKEFQTYLGQEIKWAQKKSKQIKMAVSVNGLMYKSSLIKSLMMTDPAIDMGVNRFKSTYDLKRLKQYIEDTNELKQAQKDGLTLNSYHKELINPIKTIMSLAQSVKDHPNKQVKASANNVLKIFSNLFRGMIEQTADFYEQRGIQESLAYRQEQRLNKIYSVAQTNSKLLDSSIKQMVIPLTKKTFVQDGQIDTSYDGLVPNNSQISGLMQVPTVGLAEPLGHDISVLTGPFNVLCRNNDYLLNKIYEWTTKSSTVPEVKNNKIAEKTRFNALNQLQKKSSQSIEGSSKLSSFAPSINQCDIITPDMKKFKF